MSSDGSGYTAKDFISACGRTADHPAHKFIRARAAYQCLGVNTPPPSEGALPVAPVGVQEAPLRGAEDGELELAAREFVALWDDSLSFAADPFTRRLTRLRAALAALTQSGVDEPRPGADMEARHSPRGGGA